MPFGYLTTTVLVAWCAFFAAVAPRRPWPLGVLSFRFGHLLGELPVLGLYWILASTLPALAQDDLSSPGGRVVLAAAVVTAAVLLVVVRRTLRARPRLADALTEGLGAGRPDALDAGTVARLRRRPSLAGILIRPAVARRGDVERVADISYGDAGRHHLLDVYRHRSRPQGCPTLVHWHGGGFHGGRKNREARALLYRLASRGWVCVSANYRLMPEARFPDPLVDAKRVIAWVREHGHEYGADPSTLVVAGSSAGGHLACTAALTPDDPVFQPGFEQADTSVSGVISLYGYYGPVGRGDGPPSSPSAYLRADAPPFLLVHGDKDTLVPVEHARAFARALRADSSSPVVYAELPGAQHLFDLLSSVRFAAVVDAAEAFAGWVRATRDAPQTDTRDV